jgi:hypothetical protein
MADAIQKILESRRPAAPAAEQPATGDDADKFFSILVGDAIDELFLELRFNTGMRSCFAYNDLAWFNYDPESSTIDLEFGGYLITIKGRGLGERLFDGLKRKRVSYVKEKDVEFEDHKGNAVFIESISITPPSSGEAEEQAEG